MNKLNILLNLIPVTLIGCNTHTYFCKKKKLSELHFLEPPQKKKIPP